MKKFKKIVSTLLFGIIGYFVFSFSIEWLFGKIDMIFLAIVFLIMFLSGLYFKRNYKI